MAFVGSAVALPTAARPATAAVSAAALKRPIAELGQHADAITRALDTLLTDW